MTSRRLDWLLRTRGTDLSAWPEAERRAGLALLRRSAEARQALATAMEREPGPELDPGPGQEPDGVALHRMQCAFRRSMGPRPPAVRALFWGALAACAAGGLYLGIGASEPEQQADLFASAQTVTFAALDQ